MHEFITSRATAVDASVWCLVMNVVTKSEYTLDYFLYLPTRICDKY